MVDLSGPDPLFEGISRGLDSLAISLKHRRARQERTKALRMIFPDATDEELKALDALDPKVLSKIIEIQQKAKK